MFRSPFRASKGLQERGIAFQKVVAQKRFQAFPDKRFKDPVHDFTAPARRRQKNQQYGLFSRVSEFVAHQFSAGGGLNTQFFTQLANQRGRR